MDIELKSAFLEHFSDFLGNLLSLGDELFSVVLGDHGFKDFVSNGWKNSLVVILTDVAQNFWEFIDIWSPEKTKTDAHSLKISCTSSRWAQEWLSSDFKAIDLLDKWDPEMKAFFVYFIAKSSECVHNNDSLTSINNVAELRSEHSSADHGTS